MRQGVHPARGPAFPEALDAKLYIFSPARRVNGSSELLLVAQTAYAAGVLANALPFLNLKAVLDEADECRIFKIQKPDVP